MADPDLLRSATPSGRWQKVRCWWRLAPQISGTCLLRQLTGSMEKEFYRRIRAECSDAYLGELRVECLASGRRRYTVLDLLDDRTDTFPPHDDCSVWKAEDTFDRYRHKFLGDLDGICDRAVRRKVIESCDAGFLREVAVELVALPRYGSRP